MKYHRSYFLCLTSYLWSDVSDAYTTTTTSLISKSLFKSSATVRYYSNPDELEFVNLDVLPKVEIRHGKSSSDDFISSEQCAKDLTDFMAKSHEEKLNALKHLKENKDSVIKALKIQLENKKKEVASVELKVKQDSETLIQMSSKIDSAKKFISSYMIKKYDEKRRAVMEAEQMIAKKYEQKLKALMLNPSSDDKSDLQNNASPSKFKTTTFERRNVKVAAAARVGISRWGDPEVKKVQHELDIGRAASNLSSMESMETPTTVLTLFDKSSSFSDSLVGGKILMNDAMLLYCSAMHFKVRRRV